MGGGSRPNRPLFRPHISATPRDETGTEQHDSLKTNNHAQRNRHRTAVRKFLSIPRCRDRDPGRPHRTNELSLSWIPTVVAFSLENQSFQDLVVGLMDAELLTIGVTGLNLGLILPQDIAKPVRKRTTPSQQHLGIHLRHDSPREGMFLRRGRRGDR
jgi:hypothetical protein